MPQLKDICPIFELLKRTCHVHLNQEVSVDNDCISEIDQNRALSESEETDFSEVLTKEILFFESSFHCKKYEPLIWDLKKFSRNFFLRKRRLFEKKKRQIQIFLKCSNKYF